MFASLNAHAVEVVVGLGKLAETKAFMNLENSCLEILSVGLNVWSVHLVVIPAVHHRVSAVWNSETCVVAANVGACIVWTLKKRDTTIITHIAHSGLYQDCIDICKIWEINYWTNRNLVWENNGKYLWVMKYILFKKNLHQWRSSFIYLTLVISLAYQQMPFLLHLY